MGGLCSWAGKCLPTRLFRRAIPEAEARCRFPETSLLSSQFQEDYPFPGEIGAGNLTAGGRTSCRSREQARFASAAYALPLSSFP